MDRVLNTHETTSVNNSLLSASLSIIPSPNCASVGGIIAFTLWTVTTTQPFINKVTFEKTIYMYGKLIMGM